MSRSVARPLTEGVLRLAVVPTALALALTTAFSTSARAEIDLPLSTASLPDLPLARDGAAAVHAQGYVYVIGGATRAGLSGRIDRFDPNTGRWKRFTDLLIPRRHVAAVEKDGKLYVFGGKGERGPVSQVEIVDLKTGRVSEGRRMPTPRFFASAAVYRGRIFVGGGTMGWGRSAVVEVYDTKRDNWYVAPQLGRARDTQLVVAGDSLYALGGYAGGKEEPVATWVERLGKGGWVKIGDMPVPTSSFAAASVGGFIYTFGDHREPERVLRFDPEGNKWTELQTSFFPRRHAAATSDGDRIWVIGGSTRGTGAKLPVHEELRPGAGL